MRLSTECFENRYYHELNASETAQLENFGGHHRFILMADQTSDIPPILFSETESEEEFEGFTARDARPYVEVAVKAPLFCSTPVPKVKRTRVERDELLSTSSDDDPGISSIKLLPTTRTPSRTSSTSSVEGELTPQWKPLKRDQVATLFQVSEGRNESSSSLEGEINFLSETERQKKQQQSSFHENSANCFHGSLREEIEHENPNEVPNLASRKRGKLTL